MSETSYDPQARQSADNPRAFAQGVGRVCQVWGVGLAVVMCCVWAAPLWDRGQPPERWRQWLTTVGVIVPFVLGMGFAGVGIGLVAQRVSAAWIGLALATAQLAFWAAILVLRLALSPSAWPIVIASCFLAASGGMLLLTWGALLNLLRHRPPSDLAELPPDFEERGTVPFSQTKRGQSPPDSRRPGRRGD